MVSKEPASTKEERMSKRTPQSDASNDPQPEGMRPAEWAGTYAHYAELGDVIHAWPLPDPDKPPSEGWRP